MLRFWSQANLYKSDLRPFFRHNLWLLPILGVVYMLLSPIVIPLTILWEQRRAVAYSYREIFMCFRRVKDD